jgi:FMN phosphatase YigB (HAD superfamily)
MERMIETRRIDTVLLDLDGTLIPMEQQAFLDAYFAELARFLAGHGYRDARATLGALMAGVEAMIRNDGGATNRERFWDAFCARLGGEARALEGALTAFYAGAFDGVRRVLGPARDVRGLLERLRAGGRTLYLATNPLFPAVAVRTRLTWIGLTEADFAGITTYENSRFCKPNPNYYREILHRLGAAPARCLMIGNNPSDDMSALQAGLSGYLVTDYLENERGLPIEPYRHGTFAELLAFAETLP